MPHTKHTLGETHRVDAKNHISLDPSPRGIVGQLLEIAKNHDAMSEIGGATSWRWQEGIITRMPKRRTVAKILTKAFKTEDPAIWLSNTKGELKDFIKRAFDFGETLTADYRVQDIFEALVAITLHDGRGFTREELEFRIAFIKYCETLSEDKELFINVDEELILQLFGEWAKNKADELINRFNLEGDENGYFYSPKSVYFSDDGLTYYQRRIIQLRLRFTGGNSNFDMWRSYHTALTDEEMIEIEWKVIEYYQDLLNEVRSRTKREFRDKISSKPRIFNFSCITIPNKKKESLKWEK